MTSNEKDTLQQIVKKDLLIKLDEWINEQKYQEYSTNTLNQYKANVLKFINWLKDDELITKQTTINYKNYLYELKPKPKTSSINTWIIELNKFLKWLGFNDLTIKKIKQQIKSNNEDVLNVIDYKRLLRVAKRMEYTELYYIIKVLAMTGIRISELKYFTVENLKSNYIIAFNKGKERTIIVRQDLSRELKKYCKENKIKDGYIFAGKNKNKMLAASTIWRQMKKVAGKARVNKSKVHAHSFRHLFAQVFLNEYSDNITELADILGHNSLETTRLYTRTSSAQKKSKLEKLNFK